MTVPLRAVGVTHGPVSKRCRSPPQCGVIEAGLDLPTSGENVITTYHSSQLGSCSLFRKILLSPSAGKGGRKLHSPFLGYAPFRPQ